MKKKRKRKFLINNQKHFKRKQNTFLQFEALSHHKNKRLKSHYENNVLTRKKINNIHVENHELDKTKLRDLRKRNVDYYLSS